MDNFKSKWKNIFAGVLIALLIASLCPASEVPPECPEKINRSEITKDDIVTINVSNVPITDVLKMLSAKRKVNIVSGKEVTGNVSLNLYDVTFDNALNAMLKINGYTYTKKGDIIYVKGLEKKDEFPLETLNTDTRVFRINHANPEQVSTLVEKIVSNFGKAILSK